MVDIATLAGFTRQFLNEAHGVDALDAPRDHAVDLLARLEASLPGDVLAVVRLVMPLKGQG